MASKTELLDADFQIGEGTFNFPNGDKYVGQYCAHRTGVVWREGNGKYTTEDGQTYTGFWRDDVLVDNKTVDVTYRNGAKFNGFIVKNQYEGPGMYVFENQMTLLCDFAHNKPTGEIILIDTKGRDWHGVAGQDEALLLPEHFYFNSISEEAGKGRRRYQQSSKQWQNLDRVRNSDNLEHSKSLLQARKSKIKSLTQIGPPSKTFLSTRTSRSIAMSHSSKTLEPIDSKYLKSLQVQSQSKDTTKEHERLQEEMKIFAKTKKTASDLQFESSSWYQNYVDFKIIYDNIKNKISKAGEQSLSKDEKEWYDRYLKFKQRYCEIMNARKNRGQDVKQEKVFELINSEEFRMKCPPIPVIYPTPDCSSVCDCKIKDVLVAPDNN